MRKRERDQCTGDGDEGRTDQTGTADAAGIWVHEYEYNRAILKRAQELKQETKEAKEEKQ